MSDIMSPVDRHRQILEAIYAKRANIRLGRY